MNIFRVLASGKQTFREEFVSAFLAYLLSPKMDHGLGAKVLSSLLEEIGSRLNAPELINLADQFGDRLRSDLFSDEVASVNVELELNTGKDGVIDIVVNYNNWFIMIENKIYHQSIRLRQVEKQYNGLKNLLKQRGIQAPKILVIYLVPAIPGPDSWSSSQAINEELNFNLEVGDCCGSVTWQPTDNGNEVSVVSILRKLLNNEAQGNISPMSYDVRQTLLAFIDFILGEFQGYPYDKTTKRIKLGKLQVSELLKSTEDIYVGIQYGMAGVITRAWKNTRFLDQELSVSETTRGWQYLPLKDFKILTEWALNPEPKKLSGIYWSGKPLGTRYLYLVAKSAGSEIFIGMQGGFKALQAMSEDEIRERKSWEVRSTKPERGWQWFSGNDFCRELESRGIQYKGISDSE
jgi:hypothetical protein